MNVLKMRKVLDIAALNDRSLNIAVGYDRTIYVWGTYFSDNYFTTLLPTKFSRIYDAFAHTDPRIMHKPLIMFTNNYKYIEEILNILESIGAAFDDPLTSDFTSRRTIYLRSQGYS